MPKRKTKTSPLEKSSPSEKRRKLEVEPSHSPSPPPPPIAAPTPKKRSKKIPLGNGRYSHSEKKGSFYYTLGGDKCPCFIFHNFTENEFKAMEAFNRTMKENGMGHFCLEIFGYDKQRMALVTEPVEGNLPSWISSRASLRDGFKGFWEEGSHGRKILGALFAYLGIYHPHHFHPELLKSVYITLSGVKFLSRVSVVRVKSRGPKPGTGYIYKRKDNLRQVISFISSVSMGITPEQVSQLGELKPKSPKSLRRLGILGLENLYNYILQFNPQHNRQFLFDPPFLHTSADRMHYIFRVFWEINYSVSLNQKLTTIISWPDWFSNLHNLGGVISESELYRSKAHAKSTKDLRFLPHKEHHIIRYLVNLVKHVYDQLPKRRLESANPTPPDALELEVEKKLNASFYAYRLLNEHLVNGGVQKIPNYEVGLAERVLAWPKLGQR